MKWFFGLLAGLLLLIAGYLVYAKMVYNPQVVARLQSEPNSVLAARVALLSLADGKQIPVNYLREENLVFLGADGSWWRSLQSPPNGESGEGPQVSLLIKGVQLTGSVRVELQDQEYIDQIFARLRPNVPSWLPHWLNGKLVIVSLGSDPASPAP